MRPIVRMDSQSDVPCNISNDELGKEKMFDFQALMQSASGIPPDFPLVQTHLFYPKVRSRKSDIVIKTSRCQELKEQKAENPSMVLTCGRKETYKRNLT